MFRKEYIRIESSTQHSSVHDFVVINIPEEDVEPKQIILDPDDQPMWENAKIVAPTSNSAIVQPNVDDNFVINSTHLKIILENKFDGYLSDSKTDNSRFMEKLKAMDSQIISLKEELQDMCKKYNELREENASKNHLNDDTPMCERHEAHEANYIRSKNHQNRNSYDSFSHQSPHDPSDAEKSLKELNNDVKNDLEDFKRCIHEWEKSQNISSEQTGRTDPPPPPQAQTEQVNAVFTGSGKSDDSPKTQKDPPPPIIVNNKTKKDKPIKTSKKGYHVVKTKEYPFREYIPKTSYPQRLNVDHSHLNRIIKES
ncbi:hypothetical protein Tco_1133772 [Tanacetum coccineum]